MRISDWSSDVCSSDLPQGAVFYVMDPIPPEGMEGTESDVFSVTEAQHIRWNELATSDPRAAVAFYKKAFGGGKEGAMAYGALDPSCSPPPGAVRLAAMHPRMPGYPPPVWVLYPGVDAT